MKLSISLTYEDIGTLDERARKAGLPSRSAAVHEAIGLLRQSEIEDDYVAAREDWDRSGQRELWEGVITDGLA